MRIPLAVGLVAISVSAALIYTQLTLFVIQPIGALPSGATLVITRLTKFGFIESADSVCQRITGGVNVLCRGMVVARVAANSSELMRLPYSGTLYGISTGGVEYDR
jgi:hypothetical protein